MDCDRWNSKAGHKIRAPQLLSVNIGVRLKTSRRIFGAHALDRSVDFWQL